MKESSLVECEAHLVRVNLFRVSKACLRNEET